MNKAQVFLEGQKNLKKINPNLFDVGSNKLEDFLRFKIGFYATRYLIGITHVY